MAKSIKNLYKKIESIFTEKLDNQTEELTETFSKAVDIIVQNEDVPTSEDVDSEGNPNEEPNENEQSDIETQDNSQETSEGESKINKEDEDSSGESDTSEATEAENKDEETTETEQRSKENLGAILYAFNEAKDATISEIRQVVDKIKETKELIESYHKESETEEIDTTESESTTEKETKVLSDKSEKVQETTNTKETTNNRETTNTVTQVTDTESATEDKIESPSEDKEGSLIASIKQGFDSVKQGVLTIDSRLQKFISDRVARGLMIGMLLATLVAGIITLAKKAWSFITDYLSELDIAAVIQDFKDWILDTFSDVINFFSGKSDTIELSPDKQEQLIKATQEIQEKTEENLVTKGVMAPTPGGATGSGGDTAALTPSVNSEQENLSFPHPGDVPFTGEVGVTQGNSFANNTTVNINNTVYDIHTQEDRGYYNG